MADSKKIQVVRLGSVHYQHPDLEKASSFLLDFGLIETARQDGRIYYRGFGVDPYVYVAQATLSSRRKFLGGTWVVESVADLQLAASLPNASAIRAHNAPGGGQIVTVMDPNGFPVNFIHGQSLRQTDPLERIDCNTSKPSIVQNMAREKQRRGEFRRMQPGPSPVHKLGHYGFMVPKARYEQTLNWYLSHMTLTPTDTVYDPDTGEDLTCFVHIDRGLEYSDHHSLFLSVTPEEEVHVHHSSFEINDFDTQSLGHDWLRSKTWTNCWGIGRHVLGSQIFDYWFDASGNIVEHYADGDVVNSQTPSSRSPGGPNSIHVWGPDLPLAFLTGDESHAGKSIIAPPDVLAAKPAVVST